MASWSMVLLPDILGSIFMILDLIADIAFVVHLHKNGWIILFAIAVTFIVLSALAVNILAVIGIDELGEEMSKPEMENLKLKWMHREGKCSKFIYFLLSFLELPPHILVAMNYLTVKRAKKYGSEVIQTKIKSILLQDSASAAIKEVQSVFEAGSMIYMKCFYIFLYAMLYKKNWPLLLGLAFNVVSLLFGLRNDLITVKKWKLVAFVVVLVNLCMRMIIILILAKATEQWVFFVPIGASICLLFIWGLWLLLNAPVLPKRLNELVKKSAPATFVENCTSSVMYTLFLVPEDFHTAIAIIPFFAASIAIACISSVPIGLRILMPFAGTIGQVPSKFWWKLLRSET